MQTYNVVRTDTWIMVLPSDWVQKQTTDSNSTYFEAADGSKGMYINTWSLGADDGRTPEEVTQSFKANDWKSLQNMQGYQWKVMSEINDTGNSVCVSVTDCLATQHNYRAIGKIIAAPPLVVHAFFHDYACGDYEASCSYFAHLVSALRLCREQIVGA